MKYSVHLKCTSCRHRGIPHGLRCGRGLKPSIINLTAMLHSFSSALNALATPSRAIMSAHMRDSEIASAVTRDKAGFIAPSEALATDIPMLQSALLPLSKATHVFAVNREAANIPPEVVKFIGHYCPTLTFHGGAPVFNRIVDKPRLLVAVSLNGYVGAWC
jgi:hypothetical protein